MKTATVPYRWIANEGLRLDAPPYLSGAFQTKALLDESGIEQDSLSSITCGYQGGIYNGPKFKRVYVDSANGVRFLTSSGMLMADPWRLRYLRRADAESSKLSHLRLEAGMTLISCSGTIGRTAFARPDMEGMWSSQDILKVVPDEREIEAGYLYAYLSSSIGTALIKSRTYGAIIPHLEPEHIADLPVVRLERSQEARLHTLVCDAARLRDEGLRAIREVSEGLPKLLRLSELLHSDVTQFSTSTVQAMALQNRLDAPFHSQATLEVERALDDSRVNSEYLPNVLLRFFKPPMFKRLWVDSEEFGTQFISGNDAYRYRSDEKRFVSRTTPNYDEFILERDTVIFQAAGQVYGLFGQPLLVRGWLEGLFCADDMYRLVPKTAVDGAFLFAFLRTPHGQVLLKRQACGNSIPRVWDRICRE